MKHDTLPKEHYKTFELKAVKTWWGCRIAAHRHEPPLLVHQSAVHSFVNTVCPDSIIFLFPLVLVTLHLGSYEVSLSLFADIM